MALEVTKPDFMPSDFNLLWPTRDDLLNEGDDHIRLVKLAAVNLQLTYTQYYTTNDARFNGLGQALVAVRALEADAITGLDLSQLALKDGTYPDLRAQATTKEDVGLDKVENRFTAATLQDNDETYVLSSLLYSLYQSLANDIAQVQPPDLSNYARISGTYPQLRAQATTKGDVGLGNLENYPITLNNIDSDVHYASARSVYNTYLQLKSEIESLALASAGIAGASSDLVTEAQSIFSAGSTPGTIRNAIYRTYSMTLSSNETIFTIQNLKFSLQDAGGGTQATVKLRTWFETTSGVLLSPKVEQEFLVDTSGDKYVAATFSFGEQIPYQATSGDQFSYNFRLRHEVELVSGSTAVFCFFGYGSASNDSSSLIEYAAPSNILTFS